ncbi:MAG: 7-cyano-7-deazaguanine synthase QueC [Ignavibacteria bacterium]|nr:7-cyano-7-deazaguanine synthase QueC [Ignavibacteria bacterium]
MGNSRKAVVLMSGGMDSAVTAAIVINQNYEIFALHITYEQRTQERELRAFKELCSYYKIENSLIVSIDYLKKIGGSALVEPSIEIELANFERKMIPRTYVPFRNGNLLSIAASWAEVVSANAIFIGAVEADSSGYPDCRKSFFEAFEKAINEGTKPETNIKIMTPLINMSKKDIVLLGLELGVPFELTWSCYKEIEFACGECDSCALRLRGFQQAGAEDPLKYLRKPNYL